ncbi:MAG: putative ABC exporter domain-containing protein [Planctomycetota bacterium]
MRDVCSLAWLVTRLSWGNRLRRFRRVLFLPRTLISLVIVGGYAGMLLLSVVAARFKDAGPGHHDAASSEELIYVPLALLVFLGFNLYGFGRQAGLAMAHAEARFLLEAPLSRRQIVGYYLARQQPGLAISAAFLSFLRWGMVPGSNLTLFFLGLFLVLEGVLVWGVCGRLLRCSLDDRGRSPAWTRLPLALAVAVVFVCAALARPPHALSLATLRRWLDTPPLAQLLEPLRFLVEGMVSPTLSGGLGALALLAVGDALLVTVALARPTPLEEGTLRQAELFQVFRTQGLRAWRAARRAPRARPAASRSRSPAPAARSRPWCGRT